MKDRIVYRMGKRIYLRPILEEDMPLITVWINDQEVAKYLAISLPMGPQDEKKWFSSLSERTGKDVIFAIVLVENDELIGVMGLHHIDHQHGLATTGSYIGRKDLWGKGYGTEAKMLVLDYAFNTLGLRKILSEVYDFNERSAKSLEKCGYVRQGVQKEHKWRNGRYADAYLYAVFMKDFLPRWEIYRKEFLGQKT